MIFTEAELDILAEAVESRIETGDFDADLSNDDELVICSPQHETALRQIAARFVRLGIVATPFGVQHT